MLNSQSMMQVRMASQLEIPFCFQGDVDKSFQLVFPTRTVDLVAKDEEEATLLAQGFQVMAGGTSLTRRFPRRCWRRRRQVLTSLTLAR